LSVQFADPEVMLFATVSLEYKPHDVVLPEYVAEGREYLESTLDFELISEGQVTIGDGISGYEIVGKGDLGSGDVQKFRFVLLARGKQGFAVGVAGEPTVFDENERMIETILNSFKLLPHYTYLPPTPSAGGRYTNTDYGFSIDYPAGWAETVTGRPGEIVTFMADVGLPSIIVSQSLVPDGTTLFDYGPQSSQDLSRHFRDYELLSEGAITLSHGTPAYEIVFSGTTEGYNLKGKYVVVLQGTRAFYIAGLSMPARFEQDKAVLEEVIYSFWLE
jgi:hypothetical protein